MNTFGRMTRRELVARGLGLVGVGSALPELLVRTALAGPQSEPGQHVLVVLQFSGGHDALSALVPYGHEAYHKARKATRIGEQEVLKLNNELGLHPNLTGFKELFEEGALAAIPGVGYPEPNYSHFTATDIWHTARHQAKHEPYGWIGRAVDCGHQDDANPTLSIAVGTGQAPRVLLGKEHPGIAFNRPELFTYTAARNDQRRTELYKRLNDEKAAPSAANLNFISSTSGRANASSEKIRNLAMQYKPKAEYPQSPLGNNLRVIAGLISGGLSTRVFFTHIGGFDTHGGQRLRHDRLMADVNASVLAFQRDLAQQGQAERVLTMTTSEFGRRVLENGSQGTDHGAAGAQFMFGPGLKPGIHGAHPSLTDLQGGGGGSLKHTTDFRSLYATVLEKWLGIPSQPVLEEKFALLDCIA
jgi:uncharacterized protein (DUF1501 family)